MFIIYIYIIERVREREYRPRENEIFFVFNYTFNLWIFGTKVNIN
jgi:hypothetical protein